MRAKNEQAENAPADMYGVGEISHYSFILLDTGGFITAWNRGAQELTGYSRQEAIGKHISFLYPREERETDHASRVLSQAQKTGCYEEDGIRVRKDGSRFWANIVVTPLYGKNHTVSGFVNVSRDITSQRKDVNELKNMKYALDQSSIVAITDRSGMIQYVNDKFLEISKYSRDELIGKTHRVINSKHHPKEYMENIWKTILSGKVWRGEIKNRAKDGSHYWVDTTITPLIDEYGKPKQFIAIRNDITKRKELERQKDDFIGIASHELKTPLTSLKGYLQLMQRQTGKYNDEKANLFMAKMERQIDRLSLLIQDLLDVTRIEAGKLSYQHETFDFNVLLREIVDTMQYTTDKHVIRQEGKAEHPVYGDKDRIGQVLVNLLSNAIKYSPHAEKIDVAVSSNGRNMRVCVKDSGVGIPKENQYRVFDRFYRVAGVKERTYPGLGLGLYISAEIITRHKGKIWFESEPGKGSSFCFTLPHVKPVT